MRVRNIECQLAQGQIRRYLGGDPLSDVAIEQLESHVNECEDCAEFFEEFKLSLLDDEEEHFATIEEANAPAQIPASSETHGVPRFLIDAIRQKKETLDRIVRPVATHAVIEQVQEQHATAKIYTKPLLYSLGLAGVLIAMSTILKDPTKVFGERASTTLSSATNSTAKPIAPILNDTSTDPVKKSASNSDTPSDSPQLTVPAVAASPAPITPVSQPNKATGTPVVAASNQPTVNRANPPESAKPKTPAKRTAASARLASKPGRRNAPRRSAPRPRNGATTTAAGKPAGNAIKVYDDNGTPISDR